MTATTLRRDLPVCLLIAIGGTFGLAACGADASNSTGSGITATEQADTSDVVAGSDAAGQSLSDWWTSGANTLYSSLGADDTAISNAASNEDVNGLQSACESLQSDVEQAES